MRKETLKLLKIITEKTGVSLKILMKTDSINYKLLLKKYIKYVTCCESINFLLIHEERHECEPDVKFNDDEWIELVRIAKELDNGI